MATRKYDPPTPSIGDHLHTAARAALSTIPDVHGISVSGPAVEMFNSVITAPIEKRRHEWMEVVGEGLRWLEEKYEDLRERLPTNEAFLNTATLATQAAIRTSNEEKRAALRNAVLNAALPSAPDESKQAIFVSWVDTLTLWHLRLLDLLANPPQWFARHNKQPPQRVITHSIDGMLAMPTRN